MSWSDPISDMLTRIRNAHSAKAATVEMPHSRLKGEIARLLRREGYIGECTVQGETRKSLRIRLKYVKEGEPAIRGLQRGSRCGRRIYVGKTEVPRVLGGLGVAILSTPQGLLTDKEARQRGIGGEWICSVW
jgi:small subunit ribosomal protein S8